MENRGIRVNMNKTKVMTSGECQKPVQKAVVSVVEMLVVIQYGVLVVTSGYT